MQFPTPETIRGIRMGTSCSELKVYFLLDCSDVWELGPKLVFRGSDPPPPLWFLRHVFFRFAL